MNQPGASISTLFSYGFRPFFLLAGWFAVLGIAGWLWLYYNGQSWAGGLPGSQWHAHEMLFGFIAAAIAGFMLTAVPSWTGTKGFGGWPLVALTLLWLGARVALALPGIIPFWLMVLVNLAFLPALAALIAWPLVRSPNRNTPLLVVLLALWVADAVFMAAASNADPALGAAALSFGLNLVLLLITVIGGRIVPAFTANALRRNGTEPRLRSYRALERATIAGMVLVLLVDVVAPGTAWAGGVALIAGLAHAIRLSGWNGHRTLREPIVWVLHLGYAWLPIGLLLKAAFLLGHFGWAAFWMHSLSAGAAGMMILAVMSRASLGHTGRELRVAPVMTIAYLLVAIGVATRVLGPAILPTSYLQTIGLAAALWIGGFLIYCVVYTPILLQPRVDGKPG